jgi:hypothetical protein
MKRAQDAMDDMRGRLEFVPRREFDSLRAEVAELRTQVERHMAHGAHQTPGGAGPGSGGAGPGGSASGGPGSAGTGGYGAGGSGAGDGSPGL